MTSSEQQTSKRSSRLSLLSHHSVVGSGPLSPSNHPKRAVSQPLKQLQLRLPDQAGEGSSCLAVGRCLFARRPLGKRLLGVRFGSLHGKNLQANKQNGR